MTSVAVRDLVVRFGTKIAVDGVSLSIRPQELLLLLGPSGCGKTTVLRAVAGFVEPSAGSIHFGDEDVTRAPPHARKAAMVFQSFALWPHLSVADNVAFGLREQRLPKAEIAARVASALASTEIEGFGPRRIDELSGGEQQRVAIARALVVRPRCLLLDEPLASLDAKLRRSMRQEIRRLCKSFGLTAIYVTHDQKEALAIADRVAVMLNGRVHQVGSPDDVYRRPRSRAVAAFIGETNLVEGRVIACDSSAIRIETSLGPLTATTEQSITPAVGDRVWVSIRPECLRLSRTKLESSSPDNRLRGRSSTSVYLGDIAEHHLQIGPSTVSFFEMNPAPGAVPPGAEVTVEVAPADVVVIPFEGDPKAGPTPADQADTSSPSPSPSPARARAQPETT